MKYAFIHDQRHHYAVKLLCRVLKVSRSGYYDWLKRPSSGRYAADLLLLDDIRRVHKLHRGHSGALKTWRVLTLEGTPGGKHRIARIRRENGIMAKRRWRYIVTTRSKRDQWYAPNLLQRCFDAEAPDRVWVGDVTGVPTRQGWLFLAVLIDLYSRKVVGWSMSAHNDTDLVLCALTMATEHRSVKPGLIHHTDRGSNYGSLRYQEKLSEAQIVPSMSRKKDCWDNAVAESFFGTLEFELIERQVFESRSAARTAVFEFIEVFYNRQRAHQTMDYKTPHQVDQEWKPVPQLACP